MESLSNAYSSMASGKDGSSKKRERGGKNLKSTALIDTETDSDLVSQTPKGKLPVLAPVRKSKRQLHAMADHITSLLSLAIHLPFPNSMPIGMSTTLRS